MESGRLKNLPLNQIEICDEFWNRYIRLVREVIIPYQWDILNDKIADVETSHCIKNFKIAAGEMQGDFQGAVFQDTDVAKWLEAVAYTLWVHPDEKLESLADETINLIGRAQCADGYLNTYYTIKEPGLRWTNLKDGHELYTAGHMIEAAVAYYQATGKTQFLEIVEKYADLICEVFGSKEHQCHGYPGHQEIELALVRLYQVTDKRKYLDMAKYFIDRRGVGENYFLEEEKGPLYKRIFPEFANYDTKYSQSHLPVRDQKTAEGHAVRAVYMYCAMADLAWYYKDEELMEVCKELWDDMVKRRMYITGSIGSSGLLERFTTDYDLPNDCNYSETCASIGLALFGKRMTEITRDASYMDVVEKALYNTLLSGIALDGKSFFYVNPMELWPDNCLERTSKEHVKAVRQKWYGVACCPPNIARTLASLGQYIFFEDANTLYVNLYISSRIHTNVGGEEAEITIDSDFLDTGHIVCHIGSRGTPFQIALRVPDYAKEFIVEIDGKVVNYKKEKGYAILDGIQENTEIIIDCIVPPRFYRANPKVRADVGKVAIVKGPVVYCLEEVDNGGNLSNIFVDTSQRLEAGYEADMLGGVTTVSFTGKRLIQERWEDDILYSEAKLPMEDVALKAVPYGSWGNRKHGEMNVWLKELF